MNHGKQNYANRLVVPPGPTPTLMQETARKRSLETGGAIGCMQSEKGMQAWGNYGAIDYKQRRIWVE